MAYVPSEEDSLAQTIADSFYGMESGQFEADQGTITAGEMQLAFDIISHWLPVHDAQVKAGVWDETVTYVAMRFGHLGNDFQSYMRASNPYREGGV